MTTRISLDSIYPSCNGPRMLRVRGYMEMRSTCNLVNLQMMHRMYIMIDVQTLIVMYMLIIIYHFICCTRATLQCILHKLSSSGPKRDRQNMPVSLTDMQPVNTQLFMTVNLSGFEQRWLNGIHWLVKITSY